MREYEDYFEHWIGDQKNKEVYQELRNQYKAADDCFHMRFDEVNERDREAEFDNCIKKVNEIWDSCSQEDEGIRKMVFLTKGNILLRKGQYRGEKFHDSQECYQQACMILEQDYNPDQLDFLDLMLQLNLGKYFRNMGKNNQRSDYWRAQDEFKDVKEKIEKRKAEREGREENKFKEWETHLWLEAEINIGRTQRYLYLLSEAKKCFLDIVGLLSNYAYEDKNKKLCINDSLDPYIHDETKWEAKRKQLGGTEILYREFLIQALVQLGVAYQKSRDYKMAQDICVAVLEINPENIDAANNLGVCLRKQRIKKNIKEVIDFKGSVTSEYFDKSYVELFESLAARGNRFAKLHTIKCKLDQRQEGEDKIGKEIDDLLQSNPDDQEVRLQKGLFLQEFRKLKDSQDIFEELYQESSHISKGTIGLKAYYNIAENLLRQAKFREAKKYVEKIDEECKITDSRDSSESTKEGTCTYNKEMLMDDLPEGDLLAEINKGWCLMKLGDYEAAKECYEHIMENYKEMPDRLMEKNRMMIKNNLSECYLHLIKGEDKEKDRQLLEAVKGLLEEVCEKEPNNATANWHWGYYHKLMCQRLHGKEKKIELDKALDCFRKAELYKTDDIFFHAGWVSAAVSPLLEGMEFEPDEKRELVRSIENRLRYSSSVYSMKECAMLASFIELMEKEYQNKQYEEKRLEKMYRSLARIRLKESEEGYGLFSHFMENDVFRKLEATKRGELLVALFCLYEQIIKIKEICRYKPDAGDEISVPVHYTTIDALKKLLSDDPDNSGRLRLWNTIYMNDSFEGECFVDMMRQVGLRKHNNRENIVDKKMKTYFPYLEKGDSQEDTMTPINENIYVSSFTKKGNAIHMWVPYADDAKGCAVTFADDFFDIRKMDDHLTDVSAYTDNDYPLYEIQYLDETKYNSWKKAEEEIQDGLSDAKDKIAWILDIMKEIWRILDDLEDRMDDRRVIKLAKSVVKEEQWKKLIWNFAASCLNEVRFLIKSSEYSYEDEVRMLHYSDESNADMKNFDVPRLFVEVNRDIQIKEVKLGSKINQSKVNEIVAWLTKTGKVERITSSGRHYK